MSTIGKLFQTTTFGESHGAAVGCVIDGCPSGIRLCISDMQTQVDRRRPGTSIIASQRSEADRIQIVSGVLSTEDPDVLVTLGTPICMIAKNLDTRSIDYENTEFVPRPGHADYTYDKKYGVRAVSGGGRASARETLARVAAGAVAELVLKKEFPGLEITAWVSMVGSVRLTDPERFELNPPTKDQVDELGTVSVGESQRLAFTRCPDPETAAKMAHEIFSVKNAGDSIGGIVTCVVKGLPPGIGEPVFDKLTAELAKAMMSIPATRGFEMGKGFSACEMRGSCHNDLFRGDSVDGRLTTLTNYAGGVLGGISSGMPLIFKVAFKPVSSIGLEQTTCNFIGEMTTLKVSGRHDPCVVPRCPPIVEAMTALVLCDLVLRQKRNKHCDWK